MNSKKSLDTKLDSVSYALGMDMAIKIKANFGKLDSDVFIQGYLNGLDSTGLLLKPADLRIINRYYQERKIAEINKQHEKNKKLAEKRFAPNKQRGEEFMAHNKKKEGIISTATGLQYQILKEGKGPKPKATSKVKVHYTGKIINGTVFESSRKSNKPYECNVNGVIAGWTEGLQLMNVGSKFRFFVPQELAYGSMYKSELIQPFSALVFDVELIEIVTK
jgi:FKBP-type peptidyl-prolyl cis-trans isomerase FklB